MRVIWIQEAMIGNELKISIYLVDFTAVIQVVLAKNYREV